MNVLTDEIVQWQFERVRAGGIACSMSRKIAVLYDEVRNFPEPGDRSTRSGSLRTIIAPQPVYHPSLIRAGN